MRYTKELIKNNFKKLKSFTYYRQRFDACPHFMFFLGDAHASDTHLSKYPYAQRITCAYFSKNKADWLHPFSELKFTADKIMREAEKNPRLADQMIKAFKPWEDKFYQKCAQIKKTNLKKLSDEQLLKLYRELGEIYTKKLNCSPLIDGFSLYTDTLISREIELFLEKEGILNQFVQYFEVLTAPTFISFLQEEELDLLQTIKQAKSLKKHQEKYFWIQNNYVKDNILSEKHFKTEANKYKKVDLDKKIKEIKAFADKNKKAKEKIIREIKLPKKLVTLLKITDAFNQWQDERKKGTFWATHYFSLLLAEFARRTKYTLNELKYVFPTEMEQVLVEEISKQEINKRFQGILFVWTKGNKFDISLDKKFAQRLMSSKQTKAMTELRGMSVSLGKITGKVKIVESAEEIDKVKKGDILVAVMTRPDYISAMKRASGFITDEGGITCHAAIIARELGVPCIVGTRIATRVLKDGDTVELNANHGIIKIVK